MVENKKTLWMALAGVGALAAAALVIYSMGGDAAEDEVAIDDEALKSAGIDEVKREGQMLESKYFLKLMQFIGEKTRDSTKAQRDVFTAERRKCYESKDWDGYRAQVEKAANMEDMAAQNILTQTIDALNIT